LKALMGCLQTMGLKDDLKRFEEVGEERRQDLREFIQHGKIEAGDDIQIPIKIIELPGFEYDKVDMGGVGKGGGEVGDPVEAPQPDGDDGDEPDEPGEGTSEHGHYEMDPEEFAEELDDELGLDLEPKGKQIKQEKEGPYTELARSGPDSTLDFERMYKKGLKRSLAMFFDEDYLQDVMRVDGMDTDDVFRWARNKNLPVSRGWVENEYQEIEETDKYDSIDDIERDVRRKPVANEIDSVALREEDKRHKYPEITTEYERNAVVVFMRDVSGSMIKRKRELIERIFTPLDWYLTGKYDNAEFVYIAHDSESWETDRQEFFGIESGGGTQISSAYELAKEILENRYNWREWNRYVIAAGDGENYANDSREAVIPLMKDIDANLQGYVEVQPSSGNTVFTTAESHKKIVDEEIGEQDNVATYLVESEEDVMDCIYELLSTEEEQ
jgi:uncharacterized sporulation protein YeaH/YhbH (DUF444 family)